MNPLTGFYGAATALRNAMFDRHVLTSRHLEKPVISVGNLSTGGTGKTPFVIALGELLKARGIAFDILSRGYRRKTQGVLVVDPSGNAADFGDEPLLIAQRLQAPVIVGESRYAAGREAENKFGSQLHILDDGFQHRSLARDFDIVLISARDLHDHLLPSGRLREPLRSLSRADALILPTDLDASAHTLPAKPIWRMERHISIANAPSPAIAFCGIARPEQFFTHLRASGLALAAEVVFRDHHSFSLNDIHQLLDRRRQLNAGGFVTTEKDAINLGPLVSDLQPVTTAILTLSLDRPTDLVESILARIEERKPRS